MSARWIVLLAALAGACRDPIGDARNALQANDPATRIAAACGLAGAGAAAAVAVPELIAATRDEAVADFAVFALGEVGPAASSAVPRLLEMPVDGSPLRAALVCVALARTGARRSDVMDRLEKDLRSPHTIVRQAARGALRSLR